MIKMKHQTVKKIIRQLTKNKILALEKLKLKVQVNQNLIKKLRNNEYFKIILLNNNIKIL
jgi:hypothetical protein